MKKYILLSLCIVGAYASTIGIVDFSKCANDSKYGKKEQEKLENIKSQWTNLITETEKELKEVNEKLQNEEFLEGISPEAEEELKLKQETLSNDFSKYNNQLYQILNQAHYLMVQKLSSCVAKGSEKVAKDKNLDILLNKEACFFSDPKIDYTSFVIKEMDKDFKNEISMNEEDVKNIKENEKK